MSGEPSVQVDILNNLARLSWWFGIQMLRATPFVLIAGFVLSALGGVLEGFSIAFLFWMFFMGFFFLKAILYKTVAGWIDKIDRKYRSILPTQTCSLLSKHVQRAPRATTGAGAGAFTRSRG